MLVPLLMLIVLGAIDFGRLYQSYVSTTDAAERGARYASSGGVSASDIDGIRGAVMADGGAFAGTSPSNPEVSVSTVTDGQDRLYADVTVYYSFSTLFPWPGIPDEIDLERTVRAEVAQ